MIYIIINIIIILIFIYIFFNMDSINHQHLQLLIYNAIIYQLFTILLLLFSLRKFKESKKVLRIRRNEIHPKLKLIKMILLKKNENINYS